MYNDDQNLYHNNFQQDGVGSENRGSGYQAPQPPVQDLKPAKSPKNKAAMKLAALALSCALLGGAVGGGVAWWAGSRPGETSFNVSDRPVAEVSINQVGVSKTPMSPAEVYASNVNSVVSINTTINEGVNFFGQPVQSASSGSGFVLTRDGYILTNYHVVKNAETVKVNMYNGDTYTAQYIGGDEEYDIAVIKVEAKDLPIVTLGDSGKLNVGDQVLAIGNPLGDLTFSMSGGYVSSVNRAINVSGTPFNMIQTDASINPGNSGGPLFNLYGEVVGIVSAKYSSYANQSVEGLGFAIPINDVVAMVEDIITNGYVSNKASLGINAGSMNEQLAAQFHFDVTEGVFVYAVNEGSAADKAGLKMGDVITKVNDQAVASLEEFNMEKKKFSAGDTATLTYIRDGEEKTTEVTWDAMPKEEDKEEKQEAKPAPNQEQQVPGGYMDPWDMFNFFFG